MEKNTLVTHKHLSSLGIGVVKRSLTKCIEVRFGENYLRKFNAADLIPVDVSKTKTVPMSEYKSKIFWGKAKKDCVIIENHLKRYTGMDWLFIRPIDQDDLTKFQRVI